MGEAKSMRLHRGERKGALDLIPQGNNFLFKQFYMKTRQNRAKQNMPTAANGMMKAEAK